MVAPLFEAPVALIYAAGIGAIVTWQVLVGMRFGWKYTLGGALSILADAFIKFNIKVWKFSSGHPLRWIGHKIDDANDSVYRGLTHGAHKSEQAAAALFNAAGAAQAWVAAEMAAWGETWWQGLNDLVNRDIPAARDDAVRIARKEYRGIDQLIKGTRKWVETQIARSMNKLDKLFQQRLATFRRGIDRLIKDTVRPIQRALTRANTAIADIRGITVRQARRIAALERAIAAAGLAGLKTLRRDVTRLGTRVGNLERELAKVKAGTAAVIGIAALWAALARMGLSFLRCRNVKRAGAAACGMPDDFLEDLFAGMALFGGVIGIREFVHACQDGTQLLVGGIQTMLPDDGAPTDS